MATTLLPFLPCASSSENRPTEREAGGEQPNNRGERAKKYHMTDQGTMASFSDAMVSSSHPGHPANQSAWSVSYEQLYSSHWQRFLFALFVLSSTFGPMQNFLVKGGEPCWPIDPAMVRVPPRASVWHDHHSKASCSPVLVFDKWRRCVCIVAKQLGTHDRRRGHEVYNPGQKTRFPFSLSFPSPSLHSLFLTSRIVRSPASLSPQHLPTLSPQRIIV